MEIDPSKQPTQISPSTPKSYPYIEIKCAFCPNPIYVPGTGFVSCVNCKNRICIACGPENIKLYGNKFYCVSSLYCNYCYQCDPFESYSSDDNSDDEIEIESPVSDK